MLKGKFITFYGVNNIGKSTHARMLSEKLKKEGYDPVYVKFPIYDLEPSGPLLNKIIRKSGKQTISEEELQLWFTLNRHQYEPKMKELLSEGKTIVAEDYIGTGLAWGITKGASGDWLEQINRYLIRSDLPILIDGERAKKAVEEGHIHETEDKLMLRAKQVHLDLAKKYSWQVIKLQPEKEDTAHLVWETVKEFFA